MPKVRLPFTTPIESRGTNIQQDARSVNGFVETRGETTEFIKRYGLTAFTSTATGTGNGMYQYNGALYSVTGSNVYTTNTSGTSSLIGTISTSATVTFTQMGVGAYMVFQNGQNVYYITSSSNTINTVTVPWAGSDTLVPGCAYLDGSVYVMTKGARIYNSNIEDPTTWNALNYISAESDPDNGVALCRHLNFIVAFGQWSTEFFNDVANATGSPLGRNDPYKIEAGCANANTVASLDNMTVWVSQSRTQGLAVTALNGITPQPVSTPYIDRYLNAYPTSDMTDTSIRSRGILFMF